MRFGFVTCVRLGLSCMEAIYEVGGRLDVALTLEDDMAKTKSGRVYLDNFCGQHELDLVKIRNINRPNALEALRAYNLDWLFIIGWSQIARADVLATPRKGVIGMHPTLLPVGRGRAAIPWAILKGLEKTGVTMFQMDEGVDTGPIIAQQEIRLSSDTDAGELYQAVDKTHVEMMKQVFPKLRDGLLTPVPQDDTKATEWPGREPGDGAIDLQGTAEQAERLVRAVTHPYPGAFVDIDGRRLVIWRAEVDTRDCDTDPSDRPVLRLVDRNLVALQWEWQDIPQSRSPLDPYDR